MTLLSNNDDCFTESNKTKENGTKTIETWASPWPKDDLQHLGSEAIQELAREIDKAATAIKDCSLTPNFEDCVQQLNDDQLILLMEEAYQSKKIDDEKKKEIFMGMLGDVNSSVQTATPSYKKVSSSILTRSSSISNSASAKTSATSSPSKQASSSSQSPVKLNYIWKSLSNDDSSSTKTEVEEIDPLSDLEDTNETKEVTTQSAKTSYDENGNAKGCGHYPSGASKPLSVYRHDPAFYSRHVAINQREATPPTLVNLQHHSLRQQHQCHCPEERSLSSNSTRVCSPVYRHDQRENRFELCREESSRDLRRCPGSRPRRKKKESPGEVKKSEDIDGHRGNLDLDHLVEFINSTGEKEDDKCNSRKKTHKGEKSKGSRTQSQGKTKKAEATNSSTKETDREDASKPDRMNKQTGASKSTNSQMDNSESADELDSTTETSHSKVESIPNKQSKPVKQQKAFASQKLGTLISSYLGKNSGKNTKSQTVPTNEVDPDVKSPDPMSPSASSVDEPLDEKDDEEFVIVTPRHRQTRNKNASALTLRSRESSGAPNFQEKNQNDRKSFQPKFKHKPFKQQKTITIQPSRVEKVAVPKSLNHSKPAWPHNTDSCDPLSCDPSFIHVSVRNDVIPDHDKFTFEGVENDANEVDVEFPADEDEENSAELPEDLSEITCTSSLSQDLTVTDLCDVEPYKSCQLEETQGINKIKNTPDSQPGNFNYESILKFIKEEWDIVSTEFTNGSMDFQSKIVCYKPVQSQKN